MLCRERNVESACGNPIVGEAAGSLIPPKLGPGKKNIYI